MGIKNLILLTSQNLNNYEERVSPTFWKTIDAYVSDGWDITIINAYERDNELHHYRDKFWYAEFPVPYKKISKMRKIGKFFVGLRENGTKKGYISIAEKLIKEKKKKKEKIVVYSHEVHTVSAGKYLCVKYDLPLVTRFQGIDYIYRIRPNALNKWRFKPRFQALSTLANLIIMTDDGTNGDKVLKALGNSSKTLFYRNGVDYPELMDGIVIPEINEGDIVIMTLCRLISSKGVNMAIAALPIIISSGC